MSDYSAILKIIKQAAAETIESGKPTSFAIGKVTKENPIEIFVEQKILISEDELIIPERLTEHTVECTVEHTTESEQCGNTTHSHAYKGRKKFTVHGRLKKGDKVILLSVMQGQKFIAIDRLGG